MEARPAPDQGGPLIRGGVPEMRAGVIKWAGADRAAPADELSVWTGDTGRAHGHGGDIPDPMVVAEVQAYS